jgi:hypothetical protein
MIEILVMILVLCISHSSNADGGKHSRYFENNSELSISKIVEGWHIKFDLKE